jgi:dolichyl-phosphate beta-glucosyltransferase
MNALRGLSVSVVIPAYNEERRIPATIRATHQYLTAQGANFEILVVDDGSQDRTAEAVRTLSQEFSTLKLVQLGRNCGKGRAVREGMLRAEGDLILFTDADQATSVDHLSKLLVPMQERGCQIAIASRAMKGAVLLRRPARYRVALGNGFGFLVRALLIQGVKDTQCGFKCFTREATRKIFSQLTCQNVLFDTEVLLLAARHGYRVAEVPVRWVHDPDSRLLYDFWDALGLLRELFRIRRSWGVRWPERVQVISGAAAAIEGRPQQQSLLESLRVRKG